MGSATRNLLLKMGSGGSKQLKVTKTAKWLFLLYVQGKGKSAKKSTFDPLRGSKSRLLGLFPAKEKRRGELVFTLEMLIRGVKKRVLVLD